MQPKVWSRLFSLLTFTFLATTTLLLAGCVDPNSDDTPRRQIEHPNPMGQGSTFTYQ